MNFHKYLHFSFYLLYSNSFFIIMPLKLYNHYKDQSDLVLMIYYLAHILFHLNLKHLNWIFHLTMILGLRVVAACCIGIWIWNQYFCNIKFLFSEWIHKWNHHWNHIQNNTRFLLINVRNSRISTDYLHNSNFRTD